MNIPLQHTGADARTEEQAYDDVPYQSNAFGQSQPARLAGVARLFGLNPPAIENARVLELGCASGGNLIPLAHHFPQARFVGVDLSGRQIAEGRRLIAKLGLDNIEMRHAGIESLTPADGTFDYIICHGIYSWVPAPVRDAILRVCDENLADDGVAFVSYNALPGWHFVQPVRDMMLYWTADIADPREKVKAALALLDGMKGIAENVTSGILNRELDSLSSAEVSYILHDHLEQTNTPCYLKDFVAHAQRHGLAYLSDVAFAGGNPINITPLMTAHVQQRAGTDVVRAEQYLDFLRGRRFRESLLVKESRAACIDRSQPLARLDKLHFRLVSKLMKDAAPPADMRATWWHDNTAIYRTGASVLKARSASGQMALDWVAANATDAATFSLQDILDHAAASGAPDTEIRQDITEALWDLLCTPALCLYACELRAPAPSEKPVATALARASAALDHTHTSNAFHDNVRLAAGHRRLLGMLDGHRDATELALAMGEGATAESVAADLKVLQDARILC
jgi:SAM-dependent methyltransferase